MRPNDDQLKQSESIQGDLKLVVTTLQKLERFYQDADGRKKTQLLNSIYPEKLTFDGRNFQTKRVNEAVRLIFMLDKGFRKKENETNDDYPHLNRVVPEMGAVRTFWADSYHP